MPILAGDPATLAVCVELDGTLDLDVLTAALRDLAARFATVDLATDDAPQIIVDTVDVSGHSHPRAAAVAAMESHPRPIADPAEATALLITVAPDHQVLYLAGTSQSGETISGSALVDHLSAAYAARLDGDVVAATRGSDVPPPVITGGPQAPSAPPTDFWDTELDPTPVPVSLSERRAPASATSVSESRILSASASDDLRAAAHRAGVRVEAVVVAAVTAYLGAVCRSGEVLIGLPTLVWPETAADPTVTTLPLRLSAAPHQSVAEIVASTATRLSDTRAHRSSWISHPRRDELRADQVGPTPVVNVIPFLGPVRFGEVAGDVFVVAGGPVDDLRVNVYDARHDLIRVDVEGNPGVYTRAELRAHHERFLDYLARFVVASPTTPIARIDLISVVEHIEIDQWNTTDELVAPATLTDLLEMGIGRDHDTPTLAGIDSAQAMSHGELDCRVNQLSRVLLWNGVGPESVVGVMTAHPMSGIIAMLAVLRTGAAVLPLDPTHPTTVVAHRIAVARPTCVVTDRVLSDTVVHSDDYVVDPDDAAQPAPSTSATGYDAIPPWVEAIPLDAEILDEVSDDPLETGEMHGPIHLDSAAWIAFGDGPGADGVTLTHAAMANRLQWLRARRAPDSATHVDVSSGSDALWEMLWPLTIGAAIAVVAHRTPTSPFDDVAEIAHGALHRDVVADGSGSASDPADSPLWNCAAHVLDARMRPRPVGMVGELYIAGEQVARGYHGDPGATSDRFVANPFAPGTRMFRTGLTARRLADGSIEHVASTTTAVVAPSTPTLAAPVTLADLMAAAASTAPDSVAAVVDAGPGMPTRSITFRELDLQSNRWARLLIACDVGPEDVVAVALPNGIEALTAIWSIAKSGAAFVMVDPRVAASDATGPFLRQVITESRVRVGFAAGAALSALADAHGQVRWISSEAEDFASVVGCLSARPIRPADRRTRLELEHLAYVAYSAADGASARGVAVANRGLSVFADEQRTRCGADEYSRTMHVTSDGNPVSILEMLLATSVGATMIITSGVAGSSMVDLARVVRQHAVTHAFFDAPVLEALPPDGLPDLRVVVTGRTDCTPELVERWTAPGRVVLRGYGHADTTVSIVVLDPDLRPVPQGTPGELYLTGPGLARGFLGSAALTASRFVANPRHQASSGAGSVLYRTGDIVTLGSDGRVTYLGRSDSFA